MKSGFGLGFQSRDAGLNDGFNVGFYVPRSVLNLVAGIKNDLYTQGYFNDDLTWFNGRTPTSTTYPTDLIQDPGTDDGSNFSRRWTGYFKPATTEAYTFYLNSDDASWMWIGDTAKSGWSSGNALINNGGQHGSNEVFGTVNLTADTYYPILVFFGEAGGGDVLDFSYSTNTILKTTDLTGLIYYNPTAQDGRGF